MIARISERLCNPTFVTTTRERYPRYRDTLNIPLYGYGLWLKITGRPFKTYPFLGPSLVLFFWATCTEATRTPLEIIIL